VVGAGGIAKWLDYQFLAGRLSLACTRSVGKLFAMGQPSTCKSSQPYISLRSVNG